jgi:nucleotide-binding universal stress UspA family protein
MKNILLVAHEDTGQEARLQVALDLTRALGGHLHCVDVTPLPLLGTPDWGITPAVVLLDEFKQEALNKQQLEERLAAEDISWSCEEARGGFSDCIVAAAHTADLVVLSRKLKHHTAPDMLSLASDVLVRSEALVVATDEECRSFNVNGSALVAWDGSGPAMQALRHSTPLLSLAASVHIFQAGKIGGFAIPASEAAMYLSRHRVRPEIVISPTKDDVPEQICAAVRERGASWCVMGAYGHSRLREALFGGVTREMLTRPGVPLVLAR